MESKKQMIITVLISTIFSVIVSVFVILMMSGNSGALSIQDFKVSEFEFSTDKLSSYSNTICYNGESEISCKDKDGTYLVIYSQKLVSGGTYKNIGQTNYYECIVHNGKGTIVTYDYGEEDKITKPNYEIELLGYRSFY